MLKTLSRNLPSLSGNLLVVDDAPSILIILKSFLEGDRCRLFAAENGAKALEILEEQNIDLVLLDIMMPEMGGYEVCRKMRANERTRDIPVIFLTGLGRKEEIIRGLEVGGSDYLIKPFDREELLLRVRHHLAAHANRQRLERLRQEQRIFSLALNVEIQRQADRWEPLQSELNGAVCEHPSLNQRIRGLDGFFRNVRQWGELLAGEDATMRSPVHFPREIKWSAWAEDLRQKQLKWRLDEETDVEVFADIRMVSLMFDMLLPWVISLAAVGTAVSVQATPGAEATILEISWQSTPEALDAVPDLPELILQEPGPNLGQELPLRLAHLIMGRHYGELALSREAPDCASLSLTFPNT